MLEYWMANNDTETNSSLSKIEEVLENPESAILFGGYPPWLLHFAAGCCVLFMLIGIPGNLITVVALFRTKKLRNATAVFIMNLSISDLMFCCFNLPLATSTFWYGSWVHGPLLCRLFPLLRYGLVAVSLFTVLAITINRYVMIGHPRLYPKLYEPRYLVLMVIATWIFGFGALVATWFEHWGRFGLDPVIGSCSILRDVNGRSPKEFLFILAFLAPCIAIVVCYARIFYIVRKTAKKSRRRDKVTTDLVKATIEVKYTKNFEDSALGSSCGATTTENGGSPVRSDRIPCTQINMPFFLITDARNDLEKALNLSKNVHQDESLKVNDNDEKKEEVPRLDTLCSHSHSNKSENDKIKVLEITDIDDKISVDASQNINRNRKIYSVTIPNLKFPEVNSSQGKAKEKALHFENNDQCLQVPKGFLKNLGQCSTRLLTPPSPKYETSEMSEEFPSSRSESPSERRIKKNSIFRRESRFRSIRNRALESGKMSAKDKKLLKMILVIFLSFLICYLPITITKIFKDIIDWRGLNIAGYILIYLTTCINPVIYVVMSSEYRSAYKNVLLCRSEMNFLDKKSRGK
ncbi:G-protein coupled receptor moody [Chelonus insularis]|uniref:G-protein coupled receptor moody n=1 Tax=Chelonus insularis TaxID=460826 RepID=UPI00158C6E11|nr:G-protein coupled receptor moody [Chelonus insularis]